MFRKFTDYILQTTHHIPFASSQREDGKGGEVNVQPEANHPTKEFQSTTMTNFGPQFHPKGWRPPPPLPTKHISLHDIVVEENSNRNSTRISPAPNMKSETFSSSTAHTSVKTPKSMPTVVFNISAEKLLCSPRGVPNEFGSQNVELKSIKAKLFERLSAIRSKTLCHYYGISTTGEPLLPTPVQAKAHPSELRQSILSTQRQLRSVLHENSLTPLGVIEYRALKKRYAVIKIRERNLKERLYSARLCLYKTAMMLQVLQLKQRVIGGEIDDLREFYGTAIEAVASIPKRLQYPTPYYEDRLSIENMNRTIQELKWRSLLLLEQKHHHRQLMLLQNMKLQKPLWEEENVQMLVERIKIDSIMSKLEVELSASSRLWQHILDLRIKRWTILNARKKSNIHVLPAEAIHNLWAKEAQRLFTFFGVLSLLLRRHSLRRFTEGVALLSEGSRRRIAGPLLNDEIDIAFQFGG